MRIYNKTIFFTLVIIFIFTAICFLFKKTIYYQSHPQTHIMQTTSDVFPKYGHSENFSWVAGKLIYHSIEGGCWTLEFEENRTTQTEEYHGVLALKIPNRLITRFKHSTYVVVYGKVVGQNFSMACPPTIYEVNDIVPN